MTADFDTLVRETLHGLADRAPGEAAVRAALERRHRPRFALVAVAAAVLLVAVAVPLTRIGGTTTGGVAQARFAVAEPRVLPFGFDPGWLPPGLTEQGRTVDSTGYTKVRYWHTGPYNSPEDAALSLVVNTWKGMATNGTESVDLGRMGTGVYTERGGSGVVRWEYDGFTLELAGTAPIVDKAALLRVARGLRKDAVTMLATSLEFGYVPRGVAPATTGLKRSATGAHVEVATAARGQGGGGLVAELTPLAPVVGEPDLETTVRGGPASVLLHRPGGSDEPGVVLIVPVDDRWLVIRQDTPDPDPAVVPELVKVAEGIRIGPDLDNPWADGR